jgi:RHS repeat-associated protein
VYLGSHAIAKSVTAGSTTTTTYLHTDALGTPIEQTDASKNIVGTSGYLPFGGLAVSSGTGNVAGLGFAGASSDPTGLVYMHARYLDPQLHRFISMDPVDVDTSTVLNFNRLHYAGNNPYANYYPSGRDCESADEQTTCSTDNYLVSFPQQPGFEDFTSASDDYHAYGVPAPVPGVSLQQAQQFLINNPTPGIPSPATLGGTDNDATPYIGGLSPISISPVKSFTLTNQLDGQPVVVNATELGHPLQSAIVVREAVQANGGMLIQNWGEGTAALQAPGSFWANDINNVWASQTPWAPLARQAAVRER